MFKAFIGFTRSCITVLPRVPKSVNNRSSSQLLKQKPWKIFLTSLLLVELVPDSSEDLLTLQIIAIKAGETEQVVKKTHSLAP